MRSLLTLLLLAVAVVAARPPAAAQTPAPASGDTTPVPPPPVDPAQARFLQGLRTAGRGVAQIKGGIDRLNRAESSRDSAQLVQATRRLGGLCSAARGFLVSGRGQMDPVVYEPPTRKPARDLVVQLDSLSGSAKECQSSKGAATRALSPRLVTRLRAYEAALAEFRTAIGLPNK